jgi:hypothetical protein
LPISRCIDVAFTNSCLGSRMALLRRSDLAIMLVSRIKALLANSLVTAIIVPLVALANVSTARAKACAPEHNEAVVDAVHQVFEAASHDDERLFREVLAPGFYAFDNGKRFDGMQLPELIKAAHGAGKTYVWSVNDPEVHIVCDWAWVTYTNRGSVADASGTQPMSWLESAVLRYQGQRWRVQFLHSTRAAPASN